MSEPGDWNEPRGRVEAPIDVRFVGDPGKPKGLSAQSVDLSTQTVPAVPKEEHSERAGDPNFEVSENPLISVPMVPQTGRAPARHATQGDIDFTHPDYRDEGGF